MDMMNSNWIDEKTRAVFVEWTYVDSNSSLALERDTACDSQRVRCVGPVLRGQHDAARGAARWRRLHGLAVRNRAGAQLHRMVPLSVTPQICLHAQVGRYFRTDQQNAALIVIEVIVVVFVFLYLLSEFGQLDLAWLVDIKAATELLCAQMS